MKPNVKQNEILKNFMVDNFDFDTLKKVGFFDKTIKREDYEKQAERVCTFFGFESIYQYRFETTYAHLSYIDGHKPANATFVTEFKAWHED